MKPMLPIAVGCLGILLAAGCASTPADRIKRNPELFAAFPADVQAKVRQGVIGVGYTKDMVRIAMGPPYHVVVRTAQTGETEIWVYTRIGFTTTLEPVTVGVAYTDARGRYRHGFGTTWVDVEHAYEYPVLQVEFEGDKVKTIERVR